MLRLQHLGMLVELLLLGGARGRPERHAGGWPRIRCSRHSQGWGRPLWPGLAALWWPGLHVGHLQWGALHWGPVRWLALHRGAGLHVRPRAWLDPRLLLLLLQVVGQLLLRLLVGLQVVRPVLLLPRDERPALWGGWRGLALLLLSLLGTRWWL